jgi:DNA-binding SARP family transcriptional activator
MIGLKLALLGNVAATLGDRPIRKFKTRRAHALLIYLATENGLGFVSHRREALIELLWPGMPLKSGRSSLRQTLYYLRQTIVDLPPSGDEEAIPFLLADRSSIQINPAYP